MSSSAWQKSRRDKVKDIFLKTVITVGFAFGKPGDYCLRVSLQRSFQEQTLDSWNICN